MKEKKEGNSICKWFKKKEPLSEKTNFDAAGMFYLSLILFEVSFGSQLLCVKGSSNPNHSIFEINLAADPIYNDSDME